MSKTKFQKKIYAVYKKLQNEQEQFSSDYDDYMHVNPVIVDFGNLDKEDEERDKWFWMLRKLKIYEFLLEKIDEIKDSVNIVEDVKDFIELLTLRESEYIKKEQYEYAGIISKWRKAMTKSLKPKIDN